MKSNVDYLHEALAANGFGSSAGRPTGPLHMLSAVDYLADKCAELDRENARLRAENTELRLVVRYGPDDNRVKLVKSGIRWSALQKMRPRDIDSADEDCWIYTVPGTSDPVHIIPLGPKSQELLKPYLSSAQSPDSLLFKES